MCYVCVDQGAGSGPGLGVEGLEHPWYRRDLGSQCGQVRKRKASGTIRVKVLQVL